MEGERGKWFAPEVGELVGGLVGVLAEGVEAAERAVMAGLG